MEEEENLLLTLLDPEVAENTETKNENQEG